MDGVDVVALQAAGRAGEAHLVRLQQRAGEAQEERHAEDHDDDRDQPARVPGSVMSPKPVVVSAVTVK